MVCVHSHKEKFTVKRLLKRHPIEIVLFLGCLSFFIFADVCSASQPEYILDDSTAEGNIKDQNTPLGAEFEEKAEALPLFPRLKNKLIFMSPFFRDTALNLRIRSYYYYRDFLNTDTINEAWTLGGWLEYRSGWWKDRIQIGATGYTSQPLYAPDDRGGTQLLAPGQESLGAIGQAYIHARVMEDMNLKLFRQTFHLPYINMQDSRMVPSTHEAYTFVGRSVHQFDFIASHVTRMKTRNSNDFQYMSEVAGVPGSSDGVTMAGARYSFTEHHSLGAISQYGWNLWNTLYAEFDGVWTLKDNCELRIASQFTDQRSVGDELRGDFSTWSLGGTATIGYRGLGVSFSFSTTDEGGATRNPWGGNPSYLSLMLKDFNRAGENAWLVALKYDFSDIGLDGLSAFAKYAHGDTPDSGGRASPDQRELDLTVDYRFKKTVLKGIWLRFRWAYLDQDGPSAQDINHLRLVLNYDIPVL